MFAQIRILFLGLFSLLFLAGNPFPAIQTQWENLSLNKAEDVPNSTPDSVTERIDQEAYPINYEEIRETLGYPKAAKDAGIQGKVSLRVYVSRDGTYFSHEVVESFHPLLRIPTEAFVPYLRFEPARKRGKSVASWTDVAFEFPLNQ